MNSQIRYFDKDVWVTDNSFHYYGQELPLADIQRVEINFRVTTTILYFLGCIFFMAALGYCYFRFDDWSYLLLLPLIICFGMTRYTLHHYVELKIWRKDGQRGCTVITSMSNRRWAYDLEEYICRQTGLAMPLGKNDTPQDNLPF